MNPLVSDSKPLLLLAQNTSLVGELKTQGMPEKRLRVQWIGFRMPRSGPLGRGRVAKKVAGPQQGPRECHSHSVPVRLFWNQHHFEGLLGSQLVCCRLGLPEAYISLASRPLRTMAYNMHLLQCNATHPCKSMLMCLHCCWLAPAVCAGTPDVPINDGTFSWPSCTSKPGETCVAECAGGLIPYITPPTVVCGPQGEWVWVGGWSIYPPGGSTVY